MKWRGGATWAVYLLPFMEQQNAYENWNFGKWYHYQVPAVRTFNVPSYFCPSRRDRDSSISLSVSGDFLAFPGPGQPPDDDNDGHWEQIPGALGDYVCNRGVSAAGVSGAFRLNNPHDKGVRLRDVRDGTSNSLLFGEKNVPLGYEGQGGWDCSIYDGDSPACSGRVGTMARSMRDMGWKFGSLHPSVCNFVFVDGSVHSLSKTIPSAVLGLLANIADGQSLPSYE